MALFLSSFAGSLIKAVVYGLLAFVGVKLGIAARKSKDRKQSKIPQR